MSRRGRWLLCLVVFGIGWWLLAGAASGLAADPAAAGGEGRLVIYSPHDAEPMNAGIVAFMRRYPDIKVELVAAGTGELASRIQAESANPRADVFWGGGADSMDACSPWLGKYICRNDAAIAEQFKDPERLWIGESPLPMVLFYNRKYLAEAGLQPPRSWADLLNPAFRGKIAYCQPAKSGSAYTQLCTMLQVFGGGEKGWSFVRKFVDNLDGKILESSGKCHKLVASGEYLLGITIEKNVALLYRGDPTVGFCYPSEGTSAVPDAVALVRNCPHEANARLFIDFVTSVESQREQSREWFRRPARNDVEPPIGLSELRQIPLVHYDYTWAAQHKQETLRRFQLLLDAGH